jgi:protein TonB
MRAGLVSALSLFLLSAAMPARAASPDAGSDPQAILAHLQCGAPGPSVMPRPRTLAVTYPRRSVKAHEQGQVLVSYDVFPDGTVQNIRVVQSSGYPDLDAAAQSAVAGWRFTKTNFWTRELQHIDFTLSANAPPSAKAGDFCYQPPPKPAPPHLVPLGQHVLQYPGAAIQAGEEGQVLVTLTVQADGSVSNVSVQHSSGFADLDQAGIESVKTWRYQPIAEPVTFTVKLNFAKSLIQPTQ